LTHQPTPKNRVIKCVDFHLVNFLQALETKPGVVDHVASGQLPRVSKALLLPRSNTQ